MTLFGWFFLPALFAVCMMRRAWLPGLMLMSSAFQATAVINLPVGERAFGVSPYNLAALAALLIFTVRCIRGERVMPVIRSWGWPALFLGLFVLLALPGAWFLPHFFAGMKVFLLFDPFPMDVAPVPLRWTLSNIVQAVNLCVHIVVLLFLAQASGRSDWKPERLLQGMGLGFALILFASLWERSSVQFDWPSGNPFWVSNSGYYISSLAALPGGLIRIGTPFSEPSYASVYFATMTLGLLAVAAFGRQLLGALFLAVLSGLALLNTLGATGLATAAVAIFLLFFYLSIKGFLKRNVDLRRRAFWAGIGLLTLALLCGWLYADSFLAVHIQIILKNLILTKFQLDPNEARHSSNLLAWRILQDTMGLGVGLGSNRASSYFASLLSNTGLLGFTFFVSMLFSLLWRYWQSFALSDSQLFVAIALSAATLGMGLGIPDLNFPMYWGFIFLAFVFCPGKESDDKGARDGCPPTKL